MPTNSPKPAKPPAEHEILKQSWFKSVGPRTYAAQVKKAGNGNHFLVLTEGRRDEKTGEVRKTRLFLYSEDFKEFFKMMHETAVFIRENPVPASVAKRQEKKWAKLRAEERGAGQKPGANAGGSTNGSAPPAAPARPPARPTSFSRPGSKVAPMARRPERAPAFRGGAVRGPDTPARSSAPAMLAAAK
ncbi:MAG TPA: DUF3276 family protein [Tepidisphaeraceae bacterium]|nr:DUF3276 family protein [Tepidisphaeraceae bacterium]